MDLEEHAAAPGKLGLSEAGYALLELVRSRAPGAGEEGTLDIVRRIDDRVQEVAGFSGWQTRDDVRQAVSKIIIQELAHDPGDPGSGGRRVRRRRGRHAGCLRGARTVSRWLVDLPSRRLTLGERTLEVRVRQSPTARTTRISLGADRPLEIIVPAGVGNDEIDAALADRRDWIADKLGTVEAERARPYALGLQRPGTAWLHGEPLTIDTGRSDRLSVRRQDEVLLVVGPAVADFRDVLARWYRRCARTALRAAVQEEAERLGLRDHSVTVRDQRTRWGSCSAGGNLSFNWRLIIAPEPVLRYVVVHELCHLQVPNHSKVFWRQLEAAAPGWQEHVAWLSEHGAELRAYTPDVR
jgi:predicted metal-dependent hydrolase